MLPLFAEPVNPQFRKKSRCTRSAPATSRPATIQLRSLVVRFLVVSVFLVGTRLPCNGDYIQLALSVKRDFSNPLDPHR